MAHVHTSLLVTEVWLKKKTYIKMIVIELNKFL